jgi:CelD/BcsL family acetyltransferase involved in cellulose biosynthesis
LNLETYCTESDFDALRDVWNSLVSQNAVNEVFLTWEWQVTWWAVYCPGELRLLVGRTDDGQVVGIAPWFIEAGTRTLRAVGCVDVTDYLDVIALPAHRDAFYQALSGYLADHRAEFEQLSLCNVRASSPTLAALPPYLTAAGFAVTVEQQETCPHINLPHDFEAYLESLDKKQRHELRRKMRRAENAEEASGEKVAWYIVGPEHDLGAEIERFIGLMRASHPDKAGFMDDAKNDGFFRAVVPKMAACGWLQMAFLTVNGEAAAAYINFDYDNRIGVYNSGLLPQSYAHLSCGIVLLCYLIRHNIEQERAVFDFLRGNEDYKYRMGAQDSPVMELVARPAAA